MNEMSPAMEMNDAALIQSAPVAMPFAMAGTPGPPRRSRAVVRRAAPDGDADVEREGDPDR